MVKAKSEEYFVANIVATDIYLDELPKKPRIEEMEAEEEKEGFVATHYSTPPYHY